MPRDGGSRRGKGGKYKKKSKKTSHTLTQDDIEFLKKNTRYDEQEIKEWYRGFKQDCPDGQLGKDKILEMYSMILPAGNAKVFVDQIFRIFDKDGNGSIDFKEFMMATDMTASGSPEEKLRWAFKMYDKDGSGSIELKEMSEIIETLYEMEGVSKMNAGDKAQAIFSDLDVDGDGQVDEDEFIRGCLKDNDFVMLLNAGGIDPDEYEEDD